MSILDYAEIEKLKLRVDLIQQMMVKIDERLDPLFGKINDEREEMMLAFIALQDRVKKLEENTDGER